MTRKQLDELTDLQVRILDVLWEHGGTTANDVHARLEAETGLTRKTIGTLLFRLEKQGIVGHRSDGREYVYVPRVTREQVRRTTMRSVLGRLFSGELPAMVSYALESGEADAADLARIRRILEEWEE